MKIIQSSTDSLANLFHIDGQFKRRPSAGYKDQNNSTVQMEDAVSIPSISDISTEERDIKSSTTDCETLFHLLKGNIGSGCLALPAALMHSGLWTGLFILPLVGAICVHCMHLILKNSQDLCKRTGKASLNYEETAEFAFRSGPPIFRKYARTFHHIITAFLVLTQLGFCCVYFVFVGQNIYQAAECISGGTGLTQSHYMTITLVPVLLICFIPELKYLAPLSMVANVLLISGLLIIFYYLVRDFPQIEMNVPAFAGWSTLPLFLGTAIYAFEGIGLVLPLENAMKSPSHFPGWSGVLNTGMMIVICLFTALGFFGYLRYGDTVLGSITLNLPGDEILAETVKILISLSIFLTYPLQYYVALVILLPHVVNRVSSKKLKILVEYCFRAFLVLLTFLLAELIPNIGLFINIIGAVCSSMLALVFPGIIDIVTTWPETGKYHWQLVRNIFVIFMGLFAFVTGSIMSIEEIILFFQNGDTPISKGC